MRTVSLVLVLAALTLAGGPGTGPVLGGMPPQIAADSAAAMFYDALRPYGEWIWIPACGWVWDPYDMPVDWRPYSDGNWEATDGGWYFDSDEPWAWACYHYGRWYDDDEHGWVWCPGTVWAPAWVVWRYDDDRVGWAPCPPRVPWRDGFGLVVAGIDWDDLLPPRCYSFCDLDHFCDRDLRDRLYPVARNVTLCRETKVFSELRVDRDSVVNRLPIEGPLEKRMGHPVPRVKLNEAGSLGAYLGAQRKEGEVPMFRPERHPADARRLPAGNVPELSQKFEADRKALADQQAAERKRLDDLHRAELANPRPGLKPDEIKQRQDAERKAQEDNLKRQQDLVNQWHQREQQRAAAPKAPPPQRYHVGPRAGGRR